MTSSGTDWGSPSTTVVNGGQLAVAGANDVLPAGAAAAVGPGLARGGSAATGASPAAGQTVIASADPGANTTAGGVIRTTGDTFDSVSVPGSGLTFSNDFTGSAATDTEFQNDVILAEQTLVRFYTNSDSVALTFNDPNQGNNGDVADNSFYGNYQSYSTLSGALASHQYIYSPTLPASDPTSGGYTWFAPLAYERMLGIGGGSASYTDDSVALNTYYVPVTSANDTTIVNAMMHEISEGTMGRIGGLGGGSTSAPYGSGSWAAMDLFRYNSSGVPDYSNGRDGKTTYFSKDGGATLSTQTYNNQYNSGGSFNNGGDTADFTQQEVFGTGGAGETFGLSLTDIQVMDVLGWDPYYTVSAGVTSTGITVETNGGGFVQSGGGLQHLGQRWLSRRPERRHLVVHTYRIQRL